jgi:hypothetical protein
VSFTAGVARRTTAIDSLDEVIASADTALYEAKNGGRNFVRLDQENYRAATSGVLQALYGAAFIDPDAGLQNGGHCKTSLDRSGVNVAQARS